MSGKKPYRWCFVPLCTNTTKTAPNKLFVHVPTEINLRIAWVKSARRGENEGGSILTSQMFCCQDHFNLEEDMENFMRFKLTNGTIRPRLKDGVLPHIFDCQTGIVGATPSKRSIRKRLATYEEHIQIDEPTYDEEQDPFNVCDYLQLETNENEEVDPLSSDGPPQVVTTVMLPAADTKISITHDPDPDLVFKEEPLFLNETVEEYPQEFRPIKDEIEPRSVNFTNFSEDIFVGHILRDPLTREKTDSVTHGTCGIPEGLPRREDECGEINTISEGALKMFKREVDVCESERIGDDQFDRTNEVFVHNPECVNTRVVLQQTECGGDYAQYEKENADFIATGIEPCDERMFVNKDVNYCGVEHSDKEAMMLVHESENANDGFVLVNNFNESAGIFDSGSCNGEDNFQGNNGGNEGELVETFVYKTKQVDPGGVEQADYVVVSHLDKVDGSLKYEIHNTDSHFVDVDPSQQVHETFVYETRNNEVDFVGVDKHDQAKETIDCEDDNNSDNARDNGQSWNEIDSGVYPIALWKFIPQEADSTQDTSSSDKAEESDMMLFDDTETSRDSESPDLYPIHNPIGHVDRPKRKQMIVHRKEFNVQDIADQDTSLLSNKYVTLKRKNSSSSIDLGDKLTLNSEEQTSRYEKGIETNASILGVFVDEVRTASESERQMEKEEMYSRMDMRRRYWVERKLAFSERNQRRDRDFIKGSRKGAPMIKSGSGPTECGTCGKKLRRKQCFHIA